MNCGISESLPDDDKDRPFICPCGKSYLSYPALFTHIKQKHGGKVSIVPRRRRGMWSALSRKTSAAGRGSYPWQTPTASRQIKGQVLT